MRASPSALRANTSVKVPPVSQPTIHVPLPEPTTDGLGGSRGALRNAPVVELLDQREVDERLARDDLVELANPGEDFHQVQAVGADQLDDDVQLAGRDHGIA